MRTDMAEGEGGTTAAGDRPTDDIVRFGTKIAVVLREDLPVWQKLNAAAFLASGVAGSEPDCIGDAYEDASGHRYLAMFRQPVLVFAADAERPGSDMRARMYGVAVNVPEDPATGSACACLAGYLAARTPRDGTLRWVVEQGFEMGRPSILEIEADKENGQITAVRVGGRTVLVAKGELIGLG